MDQIPSLLQSTDALLLSDIETIISSQRIEDLWSFVSNWLEEIGFERVIYGYTRFKSDNSFGDLSDLMVLTNLSAEYVHRYVEDRNYISGPMVRWATNNVGSMSWALMAETLMKKDLTAAEYNSIELNKEFGLTAGYTISFGGLSSRTKAAIGIAPKIGETQDYADKLWALYGRKIEAFCNLAHLKLISLPYANNKRQITDRQREVLEWVGEGKTTQDIATILGLTAATVEKHLRRAREVLDVDTTAQAVLKASLYNQIYIIK